MNRPPKVLSRSETGRWLGGVCSGLARSRGGGPAWIRAAFVAASVLGGLGILAYLACWLIIPQEADPAAGTSPAGSGWLVALVRACAACVGIAVLAALAAVATLFGAGWIAAAIAAAILLVVVIAWPRLGPAWALLPIAALTLPSLAVAAGGLTLAPQTGPTTVAPSSLSPRSLVTARAGLGTMLVDLRHTAMPDSGVVRLRVRGGVRRTIVALPADRCVHVELHDTVRPFVGQVASQLSGRLATSGTDVFGALTGTGERAFSQGPAPGPWLRIDFTSLGGSLYVRDYPDSVDPDLRPDWPGYRVHLEPRPDIRGVPRRAARRLIAAWQVRRAAQVRSQRAVDALMPGPCAAGALP